MPEAKEPTIPELIDILDEKLPELQFELSQVIKTVDKIKEKILED